MYWQVHLLFPYWILPFSGIVQPFSVSDSNIFWYVQFCFCSRFYHFRIHAQSFLYRMLYFSDMDPSFFCIRFFTFLNYSRRFSVLGSIALWHYPAFLCIRFYDFLTFPFLSEGGAGGAGREVLCVQLWQRALAVRTIYSDFIEQVYPWTTVET